MKTRTHLLPLIALTVASCATPAPAQEAGYIIHVDFKTRETKRAALVPITTVKGIALVGDLDVSALIELQTNIGLGIGLGKSFPVSKDGTVQVKAGLSFLDDFESAWNPRLGGYAGLSWRF